MYFDPLYFVFALPSLALALWAQWKVKGAFSKYSQIALSRNVTGLDAAKLLMRNNGLTQVGIQGTSGVLTDFYDPRNKTINLSDSAGTNSVAAVAVVAHELGHAQQDAENYGPLKLRGAIVPAVQVGAWVGPLMFMGGMLIGLTQLSWLGVLAFGMTAAFSLITLPVELNASNRAMRMLQNSGILAADEMTGARKMLDAAALTYVAAALQSLLTLLYYVMLLSGMRRRR